MRARFLSALFLVAAFASHAEEDSRQVLFFDLWKWDHWHNLELCQGEPEWVRECFYSDPSFPGERMYFPSVWHDEEAGEYRLVYSIKWSPFTLMGARSSDGIDWKPLPREASDEVPEGERIAPHHLLTVEGGSGSGVYHDPNATDGIRFRIFSRLDGEAVHERALADPHHRWHAIAKEEGPKRYFGEGITIVSRDGVDWEVKAGDHWDWLAGDWFPEPPVFVFWDERRKRHVMTARPGWGDRRQVIRESADLKNWTEPELLLQPDSLDTSGPLAFYGLPVHPVGNGAGFAGLLWTFHNANSRPVGSFNQFFGPMDAELVYSYDGRRFFRTSRKPFLRRNPIPEPGCIQVRPCSIVEVDDEIYLYSQGNLGAHGRERSEQRANPERQHATLLLHRLRRDGWMFVRPKGDWARLQSKPFALFESAITLNVDASVGEVRFQLTDVKSRPLPGRTFDDCVPLRGADGVAVPLRWKGETTEAITNRAIRLEIEFRQANLYAIGMDHHFLDAQDLWLLEDGKTIPAKRFDF